MPLLELYCHDPCCKQCARAFSMVIIRMRAHDSKDRRKRWHLPAGSPVQPPQWPALGCHRGRWSGPGMRPFHTLSARSSKPGSWPPGALWSLPRHQSIRQDLRPNQISNVHSNVLLVASQGSRLGAQLVGKAHTFTISCGVCLLEPVGVAIGACSIGGHREGRTVQIKPGCHEPQWTCQAGVMLRYPERQHTTAW